MLLLLFPPLLFSLVVFVLVTSSVWLLVELPGTERELATRRLAAYTAPMAEPAQLAPRILRRRRRYSRLPWFDDLLSRGSLAEGLSQQLLKAAVPIRAGEFLFVQLVLTLLLAVAGFLLGTSGLLPPVLLALLGAAIGFFGPLVWLRAWVMRRLAAFERGLVDALERIAGSLRAGYGIEHGIDQAIRETSGPCAEEFRQLLQELNLGADLEEAMARLVQRVDSEDARLLATAVSVQRRTGGNLIEVLSQMSEVIRERQRLRRDVRVITTAPRVSGYVVALLPVVTVITMYLTSRYYIEALFNDPAGRLATLAGAGLVGVGLYLNHRIARIEL